MSQSKGRVLVVDDEIDTAQTLGRMLETSEFTVDVFTNSKEVLAIFEADHYDLAVIDIRMPGMNGFELHSEIKSIDNKIKVLFLTALSDLHDYDDFKFKVSPKLHQRHFAQKPVNDAEFLEQVYSILY